MSAGAEPDRGIRLRQHSDWSGATIKSKAMKSTLTTKRRTVQKATQVLAVAPVLATAFFLMWLAVQPLPLHLIDQCGNQRNPRPSASIIVVGVIEADTLVRRPIPMHSDPTYPLQLRRLTVRVENVLKGGSLPKAIEVYYFTFAGGYDGPRPLGFWRVGDRRILWLRRDSGVLRTVCDGWDGCTDGVWSGAHPHYKPDLQKPLDYALVDLLFTRGEGTVNENSFGTGLDEPNPQIPGLLTYSLEKLKHLALTEHGYVKSCACRTLWIYTVDRIDASIQRKAGDAMRAANCGCTKEAHGSVECQ
jgi:hypothetical protein